MASRREQEIDHILRRAGFGATQEEVESYARLAFGGSTLVLARLLSFKQIPDGVDAQIGKPGYVGITARGEFLPTANIADARQRWLFRLVHTERPLQEKMALFWHNHFATGYTKIAGELTASLKVMHTAESFGMDCEPHHGNPGSLIMCAVQKNVGWYERGLLHRTSVLEQQAKHREYQQKDESAARD